MNNQSDRNLAANLLKMRDRVISALRAARNAAEDTLRDTRWSLAGARREKNELYSELLRLRMLNRRTGLWSEMLRTLASDVQSAAEREWDLENSVYLVSDIADQITGQIRDARGIRRSGINRSAR